MEKYVNRIGEGLIGERLMAGVTRIEDLRKLRESLVLGEIYNVREVVDAGDGNTMFKYVPMELVGKYPYIASFKPLEGRFKRIRTFSYMELKQGVLGSKYTGRTGGKRKK